MAQDERLAHIRTIADRVVRSHGLELFDVQFGRGAPGWVLRVVIDRPPTPGAVAPVEAPGDVVSIRDCERISRDLGAVLDVEDPVDRAYTLEVSSPGLDRPLRHAGDYRRFAGRLAKLVLSAAVDGQTFYEGRLHGLEEDVVVLEGGGGRMFRIPLSAIARARLEVEF